MARASTQRRRGARQNARHRSAASAEDLMFFPKLRRRAKWVFLALAIAFLGGFLFFGVGAGGSGIGDYFAELFNRNPSATGASVDDALERVQDDPENAEARLELAQAYQAEGQVDEAIAAYERYLSVETRDPDAMRALAALYGQKTAEALERAQRASAEAQAARLQQELAPTSPFAQAIRENRIGESVAGEAEARATVAQQEAQRLGRLQTGVYQDLTLIVSDDPLLFLQFAQAAETAQDYASAVAAYRRFLRLSPDDPSAGEVRERIRLLESLTGATG
jgi:tetratricopeptide (TPR) repeat protein